MAFIFFSIFSGPFLLPYNTLEPKQITLFVGQPKTIELNTLEDINLSRRGLINLSFLGNKKWRLTGLKPGFVILSYMTLTSEYEKQLFITIKKESSKKEQIFPDWLCLHDGVLCLHEEHTLKGKVNDPQLFYAAKKICQKLNTCLFKLNLTTQGINALTSKIESSFPPFYQLRVNQRGLIQINITCRSDVTENNKRLKLLKQASKQMHLDEHVIIICNNLSQPKVFKLRVKVFLMETAAAKKIGFDSLLSYQLSAKHPLQNVNFSSQFTPNISQHRLEIIGEPILMMMDGTPAHIQSGGELPFIQSKQSKSQHFKTLHAWKKYGLDLKLTLYERPSDKAWLDYQLTLKTPSKNTAKQRLHSQRLQSMIELIKDKATIAGAVHYLSRINKETSLPFLNKLPIIAPLSRMFLTEKTKMSLFLLFELLSS